MALLGEEIEVVAGLECSLAIPGHALHRLGRRVLMLRRSLRLGHGRRRTGEQNGGKQRGDEQS
jgi:hypothetical protein